MHFKICRKASSSDDCERITGNPEVISSHDGIVPTNELVLIEPINSRIGHLGSSPETGLEEVGRIGTGKSACRK